MLRLPNHNSNRTASRVIICLLGLALLTGCREQTAVDSIATPLPDSSPADSAPSEPFEADLDRLLACLRDRLRLMPAVARYKWEHGLPIEDAAREQLVIDRFVEEARTHGLGDEWSREVVSAQIAAARQVQHACFARWKLSPPEETEPVSDLATELRPRIERLSTELIEILARLETHRASALFSEAFPIRADSRLQHEAISDDIRNLATAPWRKELEPSTRSSDSH